MFPCVTPPRLRERTCKVILRLLLFLLWIHALNAQQARMTFRTISLDEGLSQSTARCMLQDRKGFIWIGTADGLNRYDGYTFTVFKAEPGSPSGLGYSVIRVLHEDRQGILWIGTEGGGLFRFDPTTERFTHYSHNPHDTTSLSNNYVWSFCEDSFGRLWVGTDGGGLNRYRPDNGTFIRFAANPSDSSCLMSDRIWSLCADQEGMIWVGTKGGGLHRLNPETEAFQRFPSQPSPVSGGEALIQSVLCDSTGLLWIGTEGGGLLRFDPRTGVFSRFRYDPQNPRSLASNRINVVFEDRNGSIWVGTNGAGLNRFVPPSTFLRWQSDVNDPEGLTDDRIWSILEDRTGGLWIGTEFGGICRYDSYSRKFRQFSLSARAGFGLNDRSVWSLLEDDDGSIWIGTASGGLNIFDRQRNRFSYFLHDPSEPTSLSNDHVRALYKDRSGTVWVGTNGGGLSRVTLRPTRDSPIRFSHYPIEPPASNGLSGSRIYSILEDQRGLLWVSARGSGLYVLNRESGDLTNYRHARADSLSLPDDFVYKIYEDRSGTIWLGTFTSGLVRVVSDSSGNPSGAFVAYQYDPYDPSTVSNNTVLTILEDRTGSLWVGTGGGGLNRLTRDTDGEVRPRFDRFTERDGLASNFVYGILEDGSGMLWVSTNRGISRFDPLTLSFINYDESDGLQSNEFNGGAYYQSPQGEMFFGGINGFNSFVPEQVKDNPHIPPIYITELRLFDHPVTAGPGSLLEQHITETEEIVLAHDQNDFSLVFTALDFSAPEKNRYRYMLVGADLGWIDANASRRQASYMNLPPDEYLFRVRGSNNDGIWNDEGAVLRITILPPFWERWWFRVAAVSVLSLLFYVGYRRRLRTERMRTELQTAHTAQMSIMPQADPEIPGFQISGTCIPAHEVGGDFFDYLWLNREHTHLCIAVGDVSGKAMDSAMTAVLASGMIASKAEFGASITDIMTHLNRSLHVKTKKSMFTALCLAALDVSKKTLSFTNAGLVRPIHASGNQVRWLETEGSKYPLGILTDSGYSERKIQLRSGDVIVFATDGVTEEQNRARELYGDGRLHDLVASLDLIKMSARSIKERIIKDVQRFSESTVQDDDITVVVVKVVD